MRLSVAHESGIPSLEVASASRYIVLAYAAFTFFGRFRFYQRPGLWLKRECYAAAFSVADLDYLFWELDIVSYTGLLYVYGGLVGRFVWGFSALFVVFGNVEE